MARDNFVTPDMIDQVRLDQAALMEAVKELDTTLVRNRSMAPDVLTTNSVYMNAGEAHRILGLDLSRHRIRLSASTDTAYIAATRSSLETFTGSTIGSGNGFLVPQFPATVEILYTGELYAIITAGDGSIDGGFVYVITEGFAQ